MLVVVTLPDKYKGLHTTVQYDSVYSAKVNLRPNTDELPEDVLQAIIILMQNGGYWKAIPIIMKFMNCSESEAELILDSIEY
jgi:hypothetical protein